MSLRFDTIEPTTLDEAVDFLFDNLSENEKSFIAEEGTIGLHHGFGTQLRNEWGLWHNSALSEHFKTTYGLGHADDMCGLLLSGLESKVKGEVFNIIDQVNFYKKHWESYGIDPLTQKEKI